MYKPCKLSVVALILSFLLVSCSPDTPGYQENAPDLTLIPTALNPTPTIRPSENTDLFGKCPEIVESLPNDLNGKLFLRDDNQGHIELDLETLEIEVIPDSYGFVTSSMHDMIAYIDSSDEDYKLWEIVVIKPDSTKISLSRRDHWSDHLNLSQITNDGKLLINSADETFLLLDPLTNDEQEAPSKFPNQKPSIEASQWSGPIYDPSMQYAVYPRNPGDENNQGRIVLWDLILEKAITFLSSNDVYGTEPEWAADSNKFAIVLSQRLPNETETHELYLVNRVGLVSQLTDFATTIPNSYISNYQWSPNSQKIAFWLIPQEQDSVMNLIILDVETNQFIMYCYSSGILADPVWSPDSKWVSVRIMEENQPTVILIEINSDRVVRIADNKTPVEWIVGP